MDHLCVLYDRNYSEPAESQYSSKPPDAQIITVSDWSTHVLEGCIRGATSQEYDGDLGYLVLPIGVMLITIARADTAFC
jgi:hypothetical protein